MSWGSFVRYYRPNWLIWMRLGVDARVCSIVWNIISEGLIADKQEHSIIL